MNHQWDGQPPAYDAHSVLLAGIELTYLPAEDARPVRPAEIERPYPSANAGPIYQPTHAPAGPAPEPVRFGSGISAAPQPQKSWTSSP